MKSIWKYQFEIEDKFIIEMPVNAKILMVEVQNGIPCMWAMVNTPAPPEKRKFAMYGTGHAITKGVYITSFQMGNYVWHLFELKEGDKNV